MVVTLLFGNYLLKNVVPNLSATLLSASFSLSTCVLLSFAQLVSESQTFAMCLALETKLRHGICAFMGYRRHMCIQCPVYARHGILTYFSSQPPEGLLSSPLYRENEAGSKCTRSRGWYMIRQDCKPRELTLAPHPSNISPGGFQGK